MLLRLDAARSRLSAHHSSPHSGMWRRGGGGGLGGGGGAQAAKQFLLSLFDGAVAGGGPGVRRGNGAGGGGSRQGAGARPRVGEWPCQCGFSTNRPHRTACFACGRAREVAEIGGMATKDGKGGRWTADKGGQKGGRPTTTYDGLQQGRGPVGAGGSRPLLGWGGRGSLAGPAEGGHCKGVTAVPNWSGKGMPPVGAGGKEGGRAKAGHGDGGKGTSKASAGAGGKASSALSETGKANGWGRPPAVYDEEGFQLVQPRRARAKGGNLEGGTTGSKGASDGGAAAPAARPRWSDDDGFDDDELLGDGDDAGGDGDACDDGDEWPADPRVLRTTYEEHAKAVREMERKGNHGTALETLRAARDDAERRWREAKPPAPLPKRLEWAEGKLRRSQATLTRLRLDLDAFDEETDRKRAELCERIQEAQAWYHWRQQQLDALHEEAADKAPGRRGEVAQAGGATELRRRIRSQTLPEMHAILEEVQEGTPLHERLALLVAGLADAEARSGVQHEDVGPKQYNLSDDDSALDDSGDGDYDMDRTGGTHDGDYVDGDGHGGPTSWKPEGPGRWSRTCGHRGAGRPPRGAEGATTDTCTTAQEARERTAGADRSRDATGGTRELGKGDDDGTPTAGGGAAAPSGSDGDDGTRAGKYRRRCSAGELKESERAESDARRARELQRQLEQATAAQQQSYDEGRGGFGSEVALSVAAQRFVLDVQRAQAQAGEMGVEPRSSDGRTLLELSPSELKQWIDDNLGDDGVQA